MNTGDVSLSADRYLDSQSYRAISPLAIAACILGVASALALIHPLFWFLPVATVAVSVLALRSISRNSDALVGRKAALVGLAAAAFFGVWAPTSLALQRVVIPRHARPFAEYWLELLRDGRVHEAHQWTVGADYRLPADVDLEAFYQSDTDAKEDLKVFLDDDVLRVLLRAGRTGSPRFVRTLNVDGNGKKSQATLDFEIATNGQTAEPIDIRMEVERTLADRDRAVQWRVIQIHSRDLEPH